MYTSYTTSPANATPPAHTALHPLTTQPSLLQATTQTLTLSHYPCSTAMESAVHNETYRDTRAPALRKCVQPEQPLREYGRSRSTGFEPCRICTFWASSDGAVYPIRYKEQKGSPPKGTLRIKEAIFELYPKYWLEPESFDAVWKLLSSVAEGYTEK